IAMVTLHAPSDHASLADARSCKACLADARESAVLIAARLWPGSHASVPTTPQQEKRSPLQLPVRVERRSIRALDHINLAFGVLATVLFIALCSRPARQGDHRRELTWLWHQDV